MYLLSLSQIHRYMAAVLFFLHQDLLGDVFHELFPMADDAHQFVGR